MFIAYILTLTIFVNVYSLNLDKSIKITLILNDP